MSVHAYCLNLKSSNPCNSVVCIYIYKYINECTTNGTITLYLKSYAESCIYLRNLLYHICIKMIINIYTILKILKIRIIAIKLCIKKMICICSYK